MRGAVWVRRVLNDFAPRRQVSMLLNVEIADIEEVMNTQMHVPILVADYENVGIVIGSLLHMLKKHV